MRDADVLRPRLGQRSRVVLIGAGFIGLELAATAAAMGNRVDVVDVAERVMQRTSSPHVSSYFERQHRNLGVRFHLGTGVSEILRRNGHIVGVGLSDGRTIEADVVIAGIGVHANDHLAARSGLAVANGIVVDDCLLSTDESISAIGDCASFPEARTGRHVRLECVQNANDQARYVASRLTGAVGPYVSLPWFWSDQGEDKLQIAGSGAEHELSVVRPTPSPGKFSVFCFAAGHLVGVESVNRAADHLIARRLLMTGIRVDPAKIADPDVDLKSLLQ
jgi:3-phenylpropionate/trans-cinnamate dioxygenase ferredoxin reductase subunit